MERKRRIRPPLVGQASARNGSTGMTDVSFEVVSNIGTEDDSRHSVREELLQHSRAEEEYDCSGGMSVDTGGSGLRRQFGAFGVSSEIKDLKPESSTQGKRGKINDNGGINASNAIRKGVKCGKIRETGESMVSARSSVMLLSPPDTQHQTFVASGETPDSSTMISEAAGSGRPPSPASVSSVTSSRRLEWDSGADVGYQNYQPNASESIPNDGFSTIERIALVRGFSAAQRLEPEGTAGSMQQLNTVQFKPVTKRSKCISKMPVAVSTPVDSGQTVGGSATGTDSECEITPVVRCPASRGIFHGVEHYYNSAERKSTSAVQDQVQKAKSKEEEQCNILSKKISSSLTDLSQYDLRDPHKNSLQRSQSYLNLLSEENYETKSRQCSNSSSFPLPHQRKRNTGLATCSVSSSSVSTIVPSHESSRMSNKHIQTSAVRVPVRNSVGIQVSENEKDCQSLSTASSFPCKHGSSAYRHVTPLNPEQETELENNSDIIDKTNSNVTEDIGIAQHIHNPKPLLFMNQNSQIVSENISCEKKNHHKLEGNRKITSQSSAKLCKGAHKKGSSEHHWCSSAAETRGFDEMSEGRLNTGNNKPPLQSCVNQSEEETTEKNSGTLDSVTSSTHTTGSWFVGDTPQSTNGNKNISGRRGSFGVVGSANSFEYLPGHVYENNTLMIDTGLHRNAITEYSSTENVSSHPVANFVGSKFTTNDDKVWETPASSTLSRDIEKGVTLFKDLVKSKTFNSDRRKKFVRQLVNRLVEANYAEDSEFLESHVPRVPPKSVVNSPGCVNGVILQKVSHEDMSSGHIVRGTMEREEVSGESASEQQGIGKLQMTSSPTLFTTDKRIETVLCETSGPSTLSENRADSRAETTTSTTQGCAGSSSTGTRITRNGYAWKELTTSSEKEYEQYKHKPGQYYRKSVLLNLCETERENQLSWIRIEIDHLTNLKQLLEKWRNLKNGFDLEMKSDKGIQKKGRNPVTCNKNSEVSTEPESLQSDGMCNSNISETHLRKSEIGHNIPVKHHHYKNSDHSLELSSSKSPKKHHVTDVFASEIHQNLPEPKTKTAFTNRRDIFTQFPTHVDLGDKRSKHKSPVNKLQLKEKAVQASASSSVSTNGDTYDLVRGVLSDGVAVGRINVFMQSKGRKAMIENDAQGSEVSDVNKNTVIMSECNDCGETAAKQSELNNSTPLCCCECKKLLSKISSKIKSKNQRSVNIKSYESHTKMGDGTDKQKYVSSSGSTIQSKIEDDSSARSCTLSSSATLGNAIDLTHDSAHVMASVGAETVRNIGVQTTQSVNSLPMVRPQWYSLIGEGTNKVSSKTQNKIGTSHKKCPCCGALEDESDTMSQPSHSTAGEWQCSRCLRMKHNRKCKICGVLESELPNIQQDGIWDHDVAWKCSNCSGTKLDQTKPVLDKCVLCGRQKGFEDRKEKRVDCGCTRKIPSATVKAPVGYLLTLETSTESTSSTAETSGKLLEEVKIKVPVRKKYSVSGKVKRREKQKQGVSKPGFKSFRQNHKPVRGVKNVSSADNGIQRSSHCRREPTLQEYLMANRPDFVQNAEYRRQCLGELAYLRELRHQSKQRLLALASHTSRSDGGGAASVSAGPLFPPPLAKKRIFNQRTMRAQTERKYRNLSEVKGQKAEEKKKEDYRTNRLMAEIFAKKLQQRVLKGDVNLSNSRSVMSIV